MEKGHGGGRLEQKEDLVYKRGAINLEDKPRRIYIRRDDAGLGDFANELSHELVLNNSGRERLFFYKSRGVIRFRGLRY